MIILIERGSGEVHFCYQVILQQQSQSYFGEYSLHQECSTECVCVPWFVFETANCVALSRSPLKLYHNVIWKFCSCWPEKPGGLFHISIKKLSVLFLAVPNKKWLGGLNYSKSILSVTFITGQSSCPHITLQPRFHFSYTHTHTYRHNTQLQTVLAQVSFFAAHSADAALIISWDSQTGIISKPSLLENRN